MYLKEDENNKKINDNSDNLSSNNDNLEEILLSNRFIKPGIFDSILPPPPVGNEKESNIELNLSSPNKSNTNNLSKNNNSSINFNSEEIESQNKTTSKISISINSLSQSKNTINNTDNISSSNISIHTSSSYDNDEGYSNSDENNLDKNFYIFEYNIPRTFNSLQIECLTRFFLKTYI